MDINIVQKKSLEITRVAAGFIKNQINKINDIVVEEKELNSLVSYVDTGAEKILVDGLKEILPGSGFITEEDTPDSWQEYTWIIDPLDGTTNFLYSVPHFAVSVALQHNKSTILGIVIEVNSGEEWTAIRREGALLNGVKIEVQNKDFNDVLIASGFPYSNDNDYESQFKVIKEWLTRTRGFRRLGSAALDLCYVACGRYGAYYEANLNAWDLAAGALIVQEAGGIVSEYNGGQNFLFGKSIVACTPTIQNEVSSILQKYLL